MNYLRKELVRRLAVFSLAVVACLAAGLPAPAANLVQEFYLPLPEQQLYTTLNTIEPGISTAQSSIYSIIVTGDGTVIYYDQWEDGYETDLGNPTQSTTKIWGDGNDAHGIPPGYAHNPLGLPAGTVITLTNTVTLPRNPSTILYDARDRIAANKALVVTHAGWPVTPGPVFGGAVSVLSTMDYGTNYISPVGQNQTSVNLFKYVGMSIMAAQNNTTVTLDPTGTGVSTNIIVLNQGESYLINGGIQKGGRITASKPVQAHLLIGHTGASYASDWFTLYPVEAWDNAYYTPVGSAASGSQPAYVYLFNPATNAITINYNTRVGGGSFSVPGTNGVYQFQMPVGSGASFVSAGGQNFFALCTVAANNTADTSYNWGFTLVPKGALTTEAAAGWAPGSADGTVDGSPVWVTPLASTKIYVDYKGDHAGPLAYTNNGTIQYYDTNFTVSALQTLKIYDPSKNQTAMRVYTVDGTLLTAAWGEDPDVAAPGNPYIDAGTTVIPFPTPLLYKSAVIVTDTVPAGLSIGDTILYTVTVNNRGLLPLGNTVVIDAPTTNLTYLTNTTTFNGSQIADNPGPYSATNTAFPLDNYGSAGYTIPVILSQGTSTFTYMVKVNAAGAVSNSVNISGTAIFTQTMLAPPPASGASVSLNFTDTNGVAVAAYLIGANVFVTMTNAVGNASSNSVQTISVTVTDTNTGDLETIPLVETGTNTGVFRNVSGLPTSATSGLTAQDGTLYIVPGDTLSVSYTDPVYLDSASASAAVQIPVPNKQLYLTANGTSGNQFLNRVNPVATAGHGTTYKSIDIGSGGGVLSLLSTNAATNGTSVTSMTMSNVIVASGSSQMLLVGVSFNPGSTVSGIKYGAQSLTQVTSVGDGTYESAGIWALLSPLVGTTNLVITFASAATDITVGDLVLNGVNQTTPFSTTNTASGNSTTPSVTIASAAAEQVFNVIASRSATSATTTGPGQVKYWSLTSAGGGNTSMGAASLTPGASSVTSSWTATGGTYWSSAAVSIKPAAGGGGPATNTTSFTQTPAFALPFTLPAGGAVSITNFIAITNGVGNFTGNLNITATLQTNGVNFLTLTNPVYTGAAGVTNLVWTGTLATNFTLPANTVITYVITNSIAGTAFHVNYDSTNSPSQIVLPASTVIAVNTFGVYDAPYPNGNLVTTPIAGTTLYVRAKVSDPFGAYDITSLGLAFTAPNTNNNFSVTLTGANVVTNDASSKTYEYQWATGPATGGYTVVATANEGTEGVKATATAGITTIYLDLGTPSTTEFTGGNNGSATNAYLANSNICVRVTDLNRNTNAATVQSIAATISSSYGDVENMVLVETGTNTGVFTGCINSTTNTSVAFGNGTNLVAPVGSVLTVSYSDPTDPTDNTSATATIQPAPGVAGIVINKTIVSPTGGQVGVGKPVVYNLQVVNVGSTTLPSLTVSDTFTSNRLSFTSASVTPNVTNATTLTWTNLGALTPGQSTNITVIFTTLATGFATNSAMANGVTATNSSSVTMAVNSAALNVVKTLLSPTNTPVSIGSNVVFRLTFQNVGNTVINNLPFEDNFSGAYFQYVSATIPANGSGYGSLLWTNIAGAGLATNAIITNDVTMTVVGAGNPANNTAVVDYATDIFGNPVPTATGSTNVVTAAAAVTGHVYNDKDQSGTVTTGDTGLGGVTLRLFTDPNGDGNPADGALVQSTTTEVNGYYEFLNLPAGHYDVVVQDRPPGYASVTPTGNQLSVNLPTLTASANNDFFDYQPSATLYSTISGAVYNDLNGGGTNYAGIAGLAYVSVELFQDVNTNGAVVVGDPIMGSTTTDANGNYSFAAISPGHYIIRETDFYGYYSTGDSQAPNDNQISFVTTNGVVSTNNSFFDRQLPTAVNDTAAALYFSPATLYPLTNDISPNGDALTISSAISTNGIVVINAGSTNLTFTPTNPGPATITYAVVDAHGGISSNAVITVAVTALADLAAGKTGPAGVFAGSNFSYTISITNLGPTLASSVVVTDSLPATVTFVSASGGGANSAGVVTWNLGSFANGAVSNVTVTVTAPASGSLTNSASVGSPTSDPNPTNNVTPPVTTSVTPVADVGLGKTGPAGITFGTNFSYTISVTNFGPSTASSVVVTDTLPAGLVFVSAAPVATTNASNQVIWTNLGSLVSGATTNLTLTVTSTLRGSVTNVAAVGSPTLDPALTNNATPPVVTAVTNIPPIANPDSYAVRENSTNTVSPLVNDVVQTPGGSLTIIGVNPTNGAASISGTNIIFTPPQNFVGTATIGYTITDGVGGTNHSLITIAVANIPPVANPDSYSAPENISSTFSPMVNDTVQTPGGVLNILSVTPTNGLASFSGTNVIFTPSANFTGTATIGYTITDGIGGTSTSLITVLVTNVPPVANPDAYAVTENTTNTLSPLGNDTLQTLGGMLSIIAVNPTNGTAVISGTNVTFTPSPNFLGTATIGYTITDGIGGTNSSLITVTVTNLPPLANPDNYSVAENTTNTFSPLGNDVVQTPGGNLSLSGVNPTNGTASISGTNVIFMPTLNFLGTATIGYTITDGIGGTNHSLITITVTNLPPVANPDSYAVRENSTNTFSPLANDVMQTAGGTLVIIAVNSTNGAVVISGTNVTFTPSPNFLGTATIGYTITDGIGGTNSSLITVTVTNLPPVANPDNYAVTENTTNTFSPLVNDGLQTPGGTLSIIAVNSTNGAAVISGTNITFTPTLNFLGTATIGYTITDGIGGTNSSLITVTVTNIPPVANPDSYTVEQNSTNTFSPLVNDVVQTPGGVLSLIGVSPTNGTASISGTNVIFSPTPGFTGTATIGYTITDGIGGTNSSVITVTVAAQADLAVTKSGPATVFGATNFDYVITVTNSGPGIAASVTVTDSLPDTVSFVSASGGGVNNAGLVTWNLDSLAAGTATNLIVTVTAPVSGVTLTNFAIAGSPTSDPNPTNNTSLPVFTTVTPVADVAIGKTGPANISAATDFTYTISVTNFGPSTASSVTVTDALPAGVTFVSASGDGANNAGVVTWNLGDLVSGAVSNVTVTVTAPAAGSLTNTASVGSPTVDPNSTSNVTPPVVTDVVPVADLGLGKSAAASVLATSNLVYTISVTNFGPSSASSVVVTDALPAGVTFVSASGDGADNAGVVTWNLGDLANDAVTNVTVTVTVPASGSLTNVASVGSPTSDPNSTNNVTPPVTTDVTPMADLAVGKSGPAGVTFNTSFSYTIAVTNFGPSDATDLSMTDSLPAGLVFVGATPDAMTNASNQVIWTNLGNLVAGATTNLTLTVISASLGSVTNVATVGSPTVDPALTNNTTPPVVTAVTNFPPVANPDAYAIAENSGTNTFAPLANDVVNNPGGSLALIAVDATNGTAVISGTNILFVPAANFVGTVTIGYTITDNVGGTSVSLITVTVTNIPPIANPDSYAVTENTTNTFSPLVNDVLQTPGGSLSIVGTSPTNGVAVINGTNIVFTPTLNFVGTATIGYTITDGSGGTNHSLITVTVTNLAPVANPDSYAMVENTTKKVNPLVNDTLRTLGGTLSIVSVSPTNGTATFTGTNITFHPATNFLGTAMIGYTITDGIGGTNSSLISIGVTNIPPVANPDAATVTENMLVYLSPLLNDVVRTPGGRLWIVSASPTNGTVVNIGTNLIFTPTTNFVGVTTVGYTITDNVGGTNSSLITVSVENFEPLANPDSYAVAENSTNTFSPLVNDVVRTPGGTLSLIGVNPTNGTAVISGTNVTFTPTPNFLGVATIGYTITDGIGGTNNSLITIVVTNIPPVANPDSYAVTENTTNTFSPLVNDILVTPGGSLSIVGTSPTNGVAVISGTNIVFTPTLNFVGTATIGYAITDGIGGTNNSLITVTVTNIPPVANPDSYAVTENTTNTFSPLANDLVLTPGGSLSLIGVSPTNGTAVINGTNVVFTPTLNFVGTATIGYTITDGIGGTNSSLITVTVTNIPPVANPDSYAVTENTTNTFSPLINDAFGTSGGTLVIIGVSPTNGTAAISGTNIVFVSATNFVGTATISYMVSDGIGGTNDSLITVTVTNIPPAANPDSYTMLENTTNTFSPLINDTVQTPGGTLAIIAVSATNGAATISGTNVMFTPTLNFFGPATIGYTITDGIGGTNHSLITITVTNLLPVANAQSATTTENTALPITLIGSDPNSLPLNFAIVSSPTNGALSQLNTNTGAVTYTPGTNYTGTDSFTFRVNDGYASSQPATVSLTVTPVADLAVAESGPTNAVAGSNLVYTVSVTNRGPATATGVVVTNLLSPGFTFVSASAGGSSSNSVVIWNLASLPVNGVTNLTVMVFALGGGTFTNLASGASAVADLNPANNDGSLANARTLTTITALADVSVFKDGGTNVYAGQAVDYTITATNAGPSTATNVVVQDNLPAGAVFQSASGSYAVSNGVVTWSGITLAPGTATTFTLTLLAPASVTSFLNVALATSPTADPNPTNNNGLFNKSRVTTKVAPSADLVVALVGPPSAIIGSNFVYTITVTNTGPSTSSNVVVSDSLPLGLTFVAASSGGTLSSNVVIWPGVSSLPVGGVTNYIITVRSTAPGVFTNVASALAVTYDPNPTNNSGVLPSSRVQTAVSAAAFSILAGTPVFNPQTGLYEELATVTNNLSTTILGFRLYVGNISSKNVSLYYADGTNNGLPFVNYNFPVDPTNAVTMILEFYDPKRIAFTNSLSAEAILPNPGSTVGTNGAVAVSRVFMDLRTNGISSDPRFVIEFASVAGKTYAVIYSSDLMATNWNVATPSVKANANITQWYDDGPPKTVSKPASVNSRYYRVIQY